MSCRLGFLPVLSPLRTLALPLPALRTLTLPLLLSGLALSLPAQAGSEREALARLVHELDGLEILIEEAESYGGRGRIRFQYGWLRTDLARVRAGIEAYLNDDREEPREVPPLRGDYRR